MSTTSNLISGLIIMLVMMVGIFVRSMIIDMSLLYIVIVRLLPKI